jgi:hypothetical protein
MTTTDPKGGVEPASEEPAAHPSEWTVRIMPDGRVMLGSDRLLGTLKGGGRYCLAKPAVRELGGVGCMHTASTQFAV